MTKTLAERFWSKVQTTPTCWIWTGSRNPNGYGILSIAKPAGGRTTVGAHRVAYELLVGPIAHELDHLCRVRHCVNPAHMEVETCTPRTWVATSRRAGRWRDLCANTEW
jgi:hypothetical protein